MENKSFVSIDKLKICYTTSKENYEFLSDFKNEFEPIREIKLKSLGMLKNSHFHTNLIQVLEQTSDSGELHWIDFGYMHFGSTIMKDNEESKNFKYYVWIEVFNKNFYTPIPFCGSSKTIVTYLPIISDSLRLTVNNITRLEIALDSTINMSAAIKKAIRNKSLISIVNNTARYDRKKVVDEIKYIGVGNLDRITSTTLYLKNSKDLELKIYDKSKELKKKDKTYISEFYGIDKKIYRSEITVRKDEINEYLKIKKYRLDIDELCYRMLFDDNILFDMFDYFSKRLIRFKKNRTVMHIADICLSSGI